MPSPDYEFTDDWFSQHAPIWERIFGQFIAGARKILEIGSYEGRSTTWLIEHGFDLADGAALYCLDTWSRTADRDPSQMAAAEARFDRNVAKAQQLAPGVRLHKIKGPSATALVKLLAEGHGGSFDFIYVDGSHQAADVLTDVVLAFGLCRVGGLIACDDYLWSVDDPLNGPKIAIDAFVNCYAKRVAPIVGVPLYQVFLRKTAN